MEFNGCKCNSNTATNDLVKYSINVNTDMKADEIVSEGHKGYCHDCIDNETGNHGEYHSVTYKDKMFYFDQDVEDYYSLRFRVETNSDDEDDEYKQAIEAKFHYIFDIRFDIEIKREMKKYKRNATQRVFENVADKHDLLRQYRMYQLFGNDALQRPKQYGIIYKTDKDPFDVPDPSSDSESDDE